jgi:outer membrane receptor protein involved in Fe transport
MFSYSDPTNLWQERIQRINLTYGKTWGKVSSTTLFSWLIYRTDELSNFGMLTPVGESGKAYRYAASDDLSLEEQLSYVPLPGLELLAGVQYCYSGNMPVTRELGEPFNTDDYKSFSTGSIADTTIFNGFGLNPLAFHRAGAYVQAFYQLDRFTFLASYRFDYHTLFDPAHSPKLAVLYRTEKDLSVRASAGTGYRAPAMYYVYNSSASRSGQGIYYDIVPNTGLKPEKVFAAEAGLRWERLSWLKIDAALFYHKIYEQFSRSFVLLDTATYPLAVNPLGLARAYVNDEESLAELIGLQASFSFRNLVPAVDLRFDVDLTLSKGREVLPNDLGSIDDYRQMPQFYGQLNISLRPHERIYLLFRNNFSSGWVRGYLPLDPDYLREIDYPVDIDGYYTLDVLSRFIISRNFEAFARFNNVTNTQYAGLDAYADENDLIYNPQPGFTMHFGLSFKME